VIGILELVPTLAWLLRSPTPFSPASFDPLPHQTSPALCSISTASHPHHHTRPHTTSLFTRHTLEPPQLLKPAESASPRVNERASTRAPACCSSLSSAMRAPRHLTAAVLLVAFLGLLLLQAACLPRLQASPLAPRQQQQQVRALLTSHNSLHRPAAILGARGCLLSGHMYTGVMWCRYMHGCRAGRWRNGAGGEGAAGVEPAELPRQVLRVQPVHGRAGAHDVVGRAVRALSSSRACGGAARGVALQLQADRVEVPVPRPRLRAMTH
jgi:hypothetical protein